MNIVTKICLKLISMLASLPSMQSAPRMREEIQALKADIHELENQWLEMAATEYAADGMIIKYKEPNWTREAICKAYWDGRGGNIFLCEIHYNEFLQLREQFKRLHGTWNGNKCFGVIEAKPL